jgi:hypothetical protein
VSRLRRRRPGGLRIGIGVLPVVLGLLDGITNALGLAAHSILAVGSGVGPGLALRVACFALVTAVFAIFVARYIELRVDLIRAGRQLNLLERGARATTRLGRAARRDALADAAQASLASFPALYCRWVSRPRFPRFPGWP